MKTKYKLLIAIILLVVSGIFLLTFVNALTEKEIGDKLLNIEKIVKKIEQTPTCDVKDMQSSLDDIKKKTSFSTMNVFGTDYFMGDDGIIFLQLLDDERQIIDEATCYLNVYYPNKSLFLSNVLMNYLADGLYYYDVVIPNVIGIYIISAKCILPADAWIDNFVDDTNLQYQENIVILNGKIYPISNLFYQTGYKNPSNYSDDYAEWTNPSFAIGSDDADASTSSNNYKQDWYNFNFTIPNNSTIKGIIVSLEGSSHIAGTTGVDIELSWDGGSSYTSTGYEYTTSNSTDIIRIFGNDTDLWKRTWIVDELNNTNFRIRLNKKGSSGVNHRIDNILINIGYTIPYSTRGIIQSVPITLDGVSWKNFSSNYYGDISWEVRNNSNYTLCSSLGDISSCANTTTPIKLFANLSNNSWIDDWVLSWNFLAEKEEIRGGGELNVKEWAGNGTTINTTDLTNQIWSWSNRSLTFYDDVTNYTRMNIGVWTYNNRTLFFLYGNGTGGSVNPPSGKLPLTNIVISIPDPFYFDTSYNIYYDPVNMKGETVEIEKIQTMVLENITSILTTPTIMTDGRYRQELTIPKQDLSSFTLSVNMTQNFIITNQKAFISPEEKKSGITGFVIVDDKTKKNLLYLLFILLFLVFMFVIVGVVAKNNRKSKSNRYN